MSRPTPSSARPDDGEGPTPWTLLFDTHQLLSAKSFDFARAAQGQLDLAMRLAGASAGFVATCERGRELTVVASAGLDDDGIFEEPRLAPLFEEAFAGGVTVVREGIPAGPSIRRLSGALTAAVVPLRLRLRPDAVIEPPGRERRAHPSGAWVKPLGLLFVACAPLPVLSGHQLELLEALAAACGDVLTSARLYQGATHDALTDLLRRPELEQHLAVETTIARHTDAPVALVMLDIDDLGRINRDHGRAQGDRVIARIARLIRAKVRAEDAVFRYGGEEFALVLPGTDADGALATAEKIRGAVEEYPGFGGGVRVHVSAGIAVFPHHADAPGKLLRKADQTLFMAKQQGGNRSLAWHRRIPRHALRSDKLIGILTGNQVKDYRNVMMLLDTIVVVNSLLEREQVLATLLDMLLQLSGAERGVLYLDRDGALVAEQAQDTGGVAQVPAQVCEPALERVARQSLPVFVHADDEEEEPELAEACRGLGLEMVLALPLVVKTKPVGCLYLDSSKPNPEFDETDLIFMQALVRELGNALEKARLYRENLEQKQALEELTARLAQKVQAQATELADLERNLSQLKLRFNYDKIVGKSEAMQKVFKLLDRITDTDVPVLIQGETGTGKELVARALHVNGPRSEGPFVSVNCSALSESLLESELFGHVRGAFTGADRDKPGLFEQAHGGTIFLDEVQDMSQAMQRELLRVLQEGEVRRVGGKEIIHVDVRVVSATNQDLRRLVKEHHFRQDLFYRLNVVSIELPPLKDRKEDVPLLVERFLEEARTLDGRPVKLAKDALRAMLRHDWPGNIRELQNAIEKSCLLMEGDTIEAEHLRLGGQGGAVTSGVSRLFELDYNEAKGAFAREYLKATLARNGGNVTRAATEAGVVRSSFHKMMRKHGIAAKDFGSAKNVTRD